MSMSVIDTGMFSYIKATFPVSWQFEFVSALSVEIMWFAVYTVIICKKKNIYLLYKNNTIIYWQWESMY